MHIYQLSNICIYISYLIYAYIYQLSKKFEDQYIYNDAPHARILIQITICVLYTNKKHIYIYINRFMKNARQNQRRSCLSEYSKQFIYKYEDTAFIHINMSLFTYNYFFTLFLLRTRCPLPLNTNTNYSFLSPLSPHLLSPSSFHSLPLPSHSFSLSHIHIYIHTATKVGQRCPNPLNM